LELKGLERDMTNSQISGIHHITALASDPQRNLDFYTDVLGLRLVKRTVNFDAPDVYHLYYGDEVGNPGTLLTFFPFPDAARGKRGTGEVSSVAFAAPLAARDYWIHRLSQHGINVQGPLEHFNEELIRFEDPDDLQLELVFGDLGMDSTVWKEGPVPAEFAIRRFRGVTVTLAQSKNTGALLTDTMGFRLSAEDGGQVRYVIGTGASQATLDVVVSASLPPARMSAGSVHHIAWRVADDAVQRLWQQKIAKGGLSVTEIIDRQYFHSIYYREPGGVLFEIATDLPGFTNDESKENLGTNLMLPPWLEPHRRRIEETLPSISVPATATVGK
jgi:glyoxalase family protein